MFCPQCRTEFPDGGKTCDACGATLVAELPEEDESDLVPVLDTDDHVQLAFARSLLEAEGIECETQGEAGQEVFGLTPLPGATGPARLLVARRDAEAARALLADRQGVPTPEDDAG